MAGVVKQVEHGLFNLSWLSAHQRRLLEELCVHLTIRAAVPECEKVNRASDDIIQIHFRHADVASSKEEQLVHHRAGTLCFALHQLEQIALRISTGLQQLVDDSGDTG